MHCLEVITARNDRAAGREEAHAENDGKHELRFALCKANGGTKPGGHSRAYMLGFEAGLSEK